MVRVDIDPRFKPDIVMDVIEPRFGKPFHVDVLWASPPCAEFTAWGLPDSWPPNRAGKKKPSLALMAACRELVDYFQPNYWIIENVRAAKPFFKALLGPVRAEVEGHVFWGRLPGLIPQTRGHKWRLPPTPDRAALRAKIPYEIGEAICRAVEARMEDYGDGRGRGAAG